MTIQITYEFPSAYGIPQQNSICADTPEKAESICQTIERLEDYKLIDVTRID